MKQGKECNDSGRREETKLVVTLYFIIFKAQIASLSITVIRLHCLV